MEEYNGNSLRSTMYESQVKDDILVENQNEEEQKENGKVEQSSFDIDSFIKEQIAIKEEGNKFLSEKKYSEAEKKFQESLANILKFHELLNKNPRIIPIIVSLYSNLALTQKNLGRLLEGIRTSMYIISNFDPYHEKSYIRIISWFIISKEFDKAYEVAEEAKKVFSGKDMSKFHEVFSLLDLKASEEKESYKKTFSKIKKQKSFLLFDDLFTVGTFCAGVTVMALCLYYKFKK